MANSYASTSDLKVRVERTTPVALSSVFTVLSGPKATYHVSGCVMRPITLIAGESFPAHEGRPKGRPLWQISWQELLDNLDNATGARFDQNRTAVHDRVAIVPRAVFRR